MSTHLFLALSLPAGFATDADDPDDVADKIVELINRQRLLTASAERMLAGADVSEGVRVPRVFVSAIPCPQWLTPASLAALRRAAQG